MDLLSNTTQRAYVAGWMHERAVLKPASNMLLLVMESEEGVGEEHPLEWGHSERDQQGEMKGVS